MAVRRLLRALLFSVLGRLHDFLTVDTSLFSSKSNDDFPKYTFVALQCCHHGFASSPVTHNQLAILRVDTLISGHVAELSEQRAGQSCGTVYLYCYVNLAFFRSDACTQCVCVYVPSPVPSYLSHCFETFPFVPVALFLTTVSLAFGDQTKHI